MSVTPTPGGDASHPQAWPIPAPAQPLGAGTLSWAQEQHGHTGGHAETVGDAYLVGGRKQAWQAGTEESSCPEEGSSRPEGGEAQNRSIPSPEAETRDGVAGMLRSKGRGEHLATLLLRVTHWDHSTQQGPGHHQEPVVESL